MKLKEFVEQYAQNLYKALEEHGYAIDGCQFWCDCCPIREQCEKSAEAGENSTCAEFIQQMVTDGKNFRTR